MLEVNHVSKIFENQRGIQDIHYTMERGEIIGFLGPNGAGKTTTMRLITGYLLPTSGTITFDGLSMTEHTHRVRSKIGYLPETPPLYPDMSVQAYLRFVADLRDVPAREQKRRVEEMMDRLGLKGREGQLIRSLSKGYKQRLGLAQAIIHRPELLILDEPTSGLDPNQILEIRQLIRELGEQHTVLLSTHILPEVHSLCNRVLIIHHGRIVLDEKPDQLGIAMGQRSVLQLEIKGPSVEILRLIRSIAEVEDITQLSMEEDRVKLYAHANQQQDIREQVFRLMAEAGYPILEMKTEKTSLEEVFQRLTTEEVETHEAI